LRNALGVRGFREFHGSHPGSWVDEWRVMDFRSRSHPSADYQNVDAEFRDRSHGLVSVLVAWDGGGRLICVAA